LDKYNILKLIIFAWLQKTLYLMELYSNIMSEIVHSHHYSKGQSDLSRYSYMCDECGVAFQSLDEYVEHSKDYHPKSIGTSIT